MPKVRRELLDYDAAYLKDLKKNHPEEYLFLAQFTDEWAGANVRKTKAGKVRTGHLHNTDALAKDVYTRNNNRNNDVLGISRANNLAFDVVTELNKNDGWYVTNPELTEDAAISNMESTEPQEILSYEEYLKLRNNMTEEMILFYETLYCED